MFDLFEDALNDLVYVVLVDWMVLLRTLKQSHMDRPTQSRTSADISIEPSYIRFQCTFLYFPPVF